MKVDNTVVMANHADTPGHRTNGAGQVFEEN
jgi:hypothetical protein